MTSYRTISFSILVLFCMVSAEDATAQSDELTLYSLFGSEELAQNINTVRRVAASLPLEDRFEYLHNWVLPSDLHPDFRVIGEFVPTDPSPRAIELEPHRFSSPRGGELVSPAFDLLETAKKLDRLEEMFGEINSLPETLEPAHLRAKLALLIMIRFEQEHPKSVEELMARLFKVLRQSLRNTESDYAPELHLLYRAVHRWEAYEAIGELVGMLHENRYALGLDYPWRAHLTALSEKYRSFNEGDPLQTFQMTETPKNWIPSTRFYSSSRGEGFPTTQWRWNRERELHLTSGNQRDYLVYRTPLAGDYEVNGELHPSGNSCIMTGGLICGPRAGQNAMAFAEYREELPDRVVEPPFIIQDEWTRYRAVVHNRQLRIFLNDRLMIERLLGEHPDPWIAVRSLADNSGAFRNLRISGSPEVPDELLLSSQAAYPGWLAYHLRTENSGDPFSLWRWKPGTDDRGEMIAFRHSAGPGTSMESLLRYHRPLVEDGELEYDFVYVPGRYEVHPALDRLVFLLDPDGVKVHWLTDGKYDRTLVTPDHVIVEPENRRGPARIPLRENAWNHLKLLISGQVVSLELNEQLIYKRELESTNLRTFGFFRYSDRREVRVRHVKLRGDWPKTLPPLDQQEFADPQLSELQTRLAELPAEFHHDFSIGGLPEKLFERREPEMAPFVTAQSDGVHVQFQANSGWKNVAIMPSFGLEGDFDVRVRFHMKDHESPGWHDGLAFLEVQLEDEENHSIRAMRGREPNARQATRAQVLWGPVGEHRKLRDVSQTSWARSGWLRVARVGDRLFSLFAPEGSDVFRVMQVDQITAADVQMRGILLELALRDGSRGKVIWKELSIKAEHMTYLAPDQKPIRKLYAMSPDGGNLRQLAEPKFGLDHLGSPEFSADGSRIVMDMSKGPTTTSHIVIMNRDGSGMKDLGMGCMPSLSKDGTQIVFTDPSAGIVLMDADGENRKTIDRSGLGAQYSPDGKYIAYGLDSNMTLIDVKSGKKTPLFEGELAQRYSRVYWNFGWSHDSRAIAFKGLNRQTEAPELAVVDLNKPDKAEVLYSANGINEDFTFSPDNRSVLFALSGTGLTLSDLYVVSRATPGRIERLDGQPDDYRILDCDWSPDGKDIVFAALVDPVPVDWPLDDGSESKKSE